ncbi:MAG: beta-lactamase family protein [Acidobacteria bacterium]|uniref:Beta-lactamase family protein n=1 Tax=Candidatus Polarisedimenticola svalbardensis TaxID=2886004 RepID=A0A8J6XYH3_9BACT|nr:beta-lactamase family protein [Candidatus Polarisedimenticola svalbardensis]
MPHLSRALFACIILTVCLTTILAEAPAGPAGPAFPDADPASTGIPARALEILSGRVQELVDNQEIVGGELVIIQNRRTVFREAFGWKDREAGQTMEVDAVYCVRSMTKPLVGTAIQMLIDENRLRLDTPVHEILPFFAGPQTGKITVRHLMNHTGGFPFTTIGKPLAEYADLAGIAAEAAGTELLFEPGSRFEYSDAGSDTLGAIVAKITGSPVERFIQERILDPMGMTDTVPLLGDNDKVKARIPSAYSGGTGSWTKHWEPTDPPIFPIFLTSQSLFSTTTDYARFLTLWMDQGKTGDRRLLSPEAVERGLETASSMGEYPVGFGDLDLYYGQQWMVYAGPGEDGSPKPVLFGHNGSDGTHAWAWPERDLMVLFFTQSRGTMAGIGLESLLQTLLIDGKLDDPSLNRRVPTKEELQQVAGMYWDETNAVAYYIVTPRENGLTVERPGSMHLVFKADKTPGRFVHEVNPQVWVEFLRSESGAVDSMRYAFGGPLETGPRYTTVDGLPSAEEIVARVMEAHGADRLPELGVVRVSGTLNYETRKMAGPMTTLFDTNRERTEVRFDSMTQIVVKSGDRAWSDNPATGVQELDGELREQTLLDRYHVRFGDWTQHYESVEVLKRLEAGGSTILLVRVVPRESPGATMYVDEETGLLRRIDSLVLIPGLGIAGVKTQFHDYRDVGGMQIPFRVESQFATPMIGKVVNTLETVETGVEVSADTFAEPSSKGENDLGKED